MGKNAAFILSILGMLFLSTLHAQTNTFPSSGNVGIGTTAPPNLVTLGTSPSGTWNSAYRVVDLSGYGYLYGSAYGTGWPGTGYGQTGWGNNQYYVNGVSYAVGTGGSSFILQGSGQISFDVGAPVDAGSPLSFTEAMHIANSGHVGIGTTSPGATLEVNGGVKLTSGSGGSITFADGTVQGTAYTGVSCGGDFAESVDVTGRRGKYEPGDLLVIDPAHPGEFQKAAQPYSTLVAGVYSTKPGYVGRRLTGPKSRDEVPLAMVGIVPTKVTAENGAIHAGDLLVASSSPGRAMKGTDRARLTGAVVGKALGDLESGSGTIEVLVTLQ